jgi:TolA-binding protein
VLGQEPSGPLPDEGPLRSSTAPTARTTTRLLAVALLFGGCATSADVAGLATQDEVLKLRTDVTSLQRTVLQSRAQTDALIAQVAARTKTQSTNDDRQAEAVNQRLDNLATTLTALGKRVDELTTRVDALGRQVRSSTVRPGPGAPGPGMPGPSAAPATPPATAGPVAPPRTAGPNPPPPSGSPTAGPATAAPVTAAPASPSTATAAPLSGPTRPTTGALQPQDLYQASYLDFSKGSYALAIDGFREFLRRYPDHPQANAAQYWIGEGYAALAQQYTNAGQTDRASEALQRAVQEFRKVVANYPRGDRTPTALYKEALTLMELKQPALAQARLQYLVDNFPQAEETPLARERLAAIKQR